MKIKDVDIKTIWMVATAYIRSPRLTLEQIGEEYGFSREQVSNILWRGIAENILSNEISEAIYHKVIKCSYKSVSKRSKRWDDAFSKREEVRTKITNHLKFCKQTILITEHCINNYDRYKVSVQAPLPKEILIEKLNSLKKQVSCCEAALA